MPSWLWRSVADESALKKLPKNQRYIGEHSAKQVYDRLAGTWTYWGWKGGYFSSEADAQIYFDEMRYMLARQMGAPNSRNGLTRGYTGLTALMAARKGIIMWISPMAN